MRALRGTACVVAVPGVGVSTPRAFREWDERQGIGSREQGVADEKAERLTGNPQPDKLEELSHVYASVLQQPTEMQPGTSGIVRGLDPEKQQELGSTLNGLAENPLLALVRTGIENDFEQGVFPQYPFLREIKHELMGTPADPNGALYAALSGSGSA